MDLTERSRRLLDGAHYATLATVGASGEPWACTVHYVWLDNPLRLLYCSVSGARHSQDIVENSQVSGTLILPGAESGAPLGAADGAQFTAVCGAVPDAELERYHNHFFGTLFPDPAARAEWALPLHAFRAPGDHRLYVAEVQRLWLPDFSTWARDKIDRRIEVETTRLKHASTIS